MAYRIRNRFSGEWLEWDCRVPLEGRRSSAASSGALLNLPMTEEESVEFLDMELRDCKEVVTPSRLFCITH